MPNNDSHSSDNHPMPASPMRRALEAIEAEMLALPEAQLMVVNTDLLRASTIVRAAWPRISPFRAQIAKELPEFDLARLDKIETYALAAAQAHVEDAASELTDEQLDALHARGIEVRQLLRSDVGSQVQHRRIDKQTLTSLKMEIGYKNLAFDLMLLSTAYRQSWKSIEGKTALASEEIDEAEHLAEKLHAAAGRRDQPELAPSDTSVRAQRAFTLLFNAYDDAQRAITFLRWRQGDADRIAPSLYGGRGHRKSERQPASPTDGTTEPVDGGHASPVPGGNGAPAAPLVPGGPGGDPFVG